MEFGDGNQFDVETMLEPLLDRTSLYFVFLINDDYTPMDFVILVLERFFGKNFEEAISLMLKIHHQGRAQCGIYTEGKASQKVKEVTDFARSNEHPLLCVMEAVA